MSYFHSVGKSTRSRGGRILPLLGLLKGHTRNKSNRYVKGSGIGATNIVIRQEKRSRCSVPVNKPKEKTKIKDETLSDAVTTESRADVLLETDISKTDINYDTSANSHIDIYHLDNLISRKIEQIADTDLGETFHIYAEYDLESLITHSTEYNVTYDNSESVTGDYYQWEISVFIIDANEPYEVVIKMISYE